MHFLIDAYNLIFTAPVEAPTIEQRREKVIRLIGDYFNDRSLDATLVFDGKVSQDLPLNSYHIQGIKIVFSFDGETADDEIINIVSCSDKPKQITVVTSDAELKKRASLRGCHTMWINEFTRKIIPKNKRHVEQKVDNLSGTEKKQLTKIFEKRAERD